MGRTDTALFHFLLVTCFQIGSGTPCDGEACPSHAQALIQTQHSSSIKNSLSGGQDSAGLLSQVRARVEEVVRNGESLSPAEDAMFQSILDLLISTTLPAIAKGHIDDQSFINGGLKNLQDCGSAFDAAKVVADNAKETIVDVKSSTHRTCRILQKVKKGIVDKSWLRLTSFWNNLDAPEKGLLSNGATFFSDGLEWFKSNQATYLTKRRNHTVESANYTQQISTCDLAQRSLEVGYCEWHLSTTNALNAYNTCWINMHLAFVGINDTATDSTLQRSTQFVATKKIECYLKVLQEKDRAQAKQALQPCQDLNPDMSQFILMNRTAPDEKTRANLGNLTLKPGDEEWTQNHYGGLDATLTVTACA